MHGLMMILMAELMRKKFHGDQCRYSQIIQSYRNVTGRGRKRPGGRAHKAADDTADDANLRVPATLRWLEEDLGVPATTKSKPEKKACMLIAL